MSAWQPFELARQGSQRRRTSSWDISTLGCSPVWQPTASSVSPRACAPPGTSPRFGAATGKWLPDPKGAGSTMRHENGTPVIDFDLPHGELPAAVQEAFDEYKRLCALWVEANAIVMGEAETVEDGRR